MEKHTNRIRSARDIQTKRDKKADLAFNLDSTKGKGGRVRPILWREEGWKAAGRVSVWHLHLTGWNFVIFCFSRFRNLVFRANFLRVWSSVIDRLIRSLAGYGEGESTFHFALF